MQRTHARTSPHTRTAGIDGWVDGWARLGAGQPGRCGEVGVLLPARSVLRRVGAGRGARDLRERGPLRAGQAVGAQARHHPVLVPGAPVPAPVPDGRVPLRGHPRPHQPALPARQRPRRPRQRALPQQQLRPLPHAGTRHPLSCSSRIACVRAVRGAFPSAEWWRVAGVLGQGAVLHLPGQAPHARPSSSAGHRRRVGHRQVGPPRQLCQALPVPFGISWTLIPNCGGTHALVVVCREHHPEDMVLCHYVGCSPSSTIYSLLLWRILAEVYDFLNLAWSLPDRYTWTSTPRRAHGARNLARPHTHSSHLYLSRACRACQAKHGGHHAGVPQAAGEGTRGGGQPVPPAAAAGHRRPQQARPARQRHGPRLAPLHPPRHGPPPRLHHPRYSAHPRAPFPPPPAACAHLV